MASYCSTCVELDVEMKLEKERSMLYIVVPMIIIDEIMLLMTGKVNQCWSLLVESGYEELQRGLKRKSEAEWVLASPGALSVMTDLAAPVSYNG